MTRDCWTFVLADSLEKVFADEAPRPFDPAIPLAAFPGQTVSFQLAFRAPPARSFDDVGALLVTAEAPGTVALSSVDLVPCTLVAFDGHDDGWLRDAPGLYPDLLRPLGADGRVVPILGGWRAVWVAFTAPAELDEVIDLVVRVRSERTGAELHVATLPVTVSSIPLPDLDIVNTHWIHTDCLATQYGDAVFSEGWWEAVDRTIAKAAEMRVNAVLTPTWTPPLDTVVGGARGPVQLVDVHDEDGAYRFGFDRLARWLDVCRRHGMRLIEIAHLFTQWGAKATPAIRVRTDDGEEQRFGWHVAATDPEYRRLLTALLPRLRAFLDAEWGEDRVLWHLSDEPSGEDGLAGYRAAHAVVGDLLEGCTVVDALSDIEFFRTGLVPVPVVATDAAEAFLLEGPERPWFYYCVQQQVDVANRFVGMPSSRSRVLGTQLFLHRAAGFLHWGFDFTSTEGSTAPVDPFTELSAGGAFLAGDPFVVYPGPDRTPWESIRFRVLAEAMDDHRMMQALRDRAGEDAVRAIVDPDGTVTMRRYSLDPTHYRTAAARLAAAIRASG